MINNPTMSDNTINGRNYSSAKGYTGSFPPLVQMLALLPLLIFYEISVLVMDFRGAAPLDRQSRQVLEKVGLSAYYLPGLMVLVTLLAIHLYRRDPWKFDARQIWKLWGEALLLTVPLFVIFLLFTAPVHKFIASGQLSMLSNHDRKFDFVNVVLGTGEAVFEEFVFRLIALPLLMAMMLKLFRAPLKTAEIIAICLSAAIFAAGHHIVPGSSPNQIQFLFRVAGGMYLAAIFLMRGFATVTIAHAGYNLLSMIYAYCV